MRELTTEQIKLAKEHMKNIVEHMQHDNHEDCFRVLTTQYGVLKQLFTMAGLNQVDHVVDISHEDTALDDDELQVEMDEQDNEEVIGSDDTTHDEDKQSTRPMYRVERKLRGAYVPDIDGYIPETILRNEGIEHGDFVYADFLETQQDGNNRFAYELAKKSHEDLPENMSMYSYCPVERDGSMLVLNRSSATGETIRLHEAPFTVLISDGDIERFDIAEGDVVDVAFYESNPSSARISWKHDVQDIIRVDKHEGKRKAGSSSNESTNDSDDIEQVFTGQTICIVGDKPNEASYKALIEERGGNHLHVEPKWSPSRIETMVKKADAVIGLYDMSSHTGLEKTKEFCKMYDVPFEMISGRGKTKTIQTAMDLINEQVSVSS